MFTRIIEITMAILGEQGTEIGSFRRANYTSGGRNQRPNGRRALTARVLHPPNLALLPSPLF